MEWLIHRPAALCAERATALHAARKPNDAPFEFTTFETVEVACPHFLKLENSRYLIDVKEKKLVSAGWHSGCDTETGPPRHVVSLATALPGSRRERCQSKETRIWKCNHKSR
ncbi:hypothetical protein [Cupriavidus basilensis]